MNERRHRLDFFEEAATRVGIPREVRVEELERHVLPEVLMEGAEHGAEAAAPERLHEAVLSGDQLTDLRTAHDLLHDLGAGDGGLRDERREVDREPGSGVEGRLS